MKSARQYHLNDDLSASHRGTDKDPRHPDDERGDDDRVEGALLSKSARGIRGWGNASDWQRAHHATARVGKSKTKSKVVVADAKEGYSRGEEGQLTVAPRGRGGVSFPLNGDLNPPLFVTALELQQGARIPDRGQDMRLTLWPNGATHSLQPPVSSRREMVAKAPLALQIEAFIRKEHRQFLLDHPGCAKSETLHIFREAFRVLSEHFCEYRGVLTLIQDEYEAALTDVLEQVRQMRIIDLENKSDRSLHAMELAAIKESLNTTISNQRAELQSAQGLIHALREQLASAESANELLRREMRRNNKEQIHSLEQVKMLSNTIIEEASRSANMLMSIKKKDKDIELLNSCVKVLREEVEELHTSLLEQLRIAMEHRASGSVSALPLRDTSKSNKALQKMKEATKSDVEEVDEEMQVKAPNTYPEDYVRSLLNKLDELSLNVVKWKTKAKELTAARKMVDSNGSPYTSVLLGESKPRHTIVPSNASILNRTGGDETTNTSLINSPKFVETTTGTIVTGDGGKRSSTAAPQGSPVDDAESFFQRDLVTLSGSRYSCTGSPNMLLMPQQRSKLVPSENAPSSHSNLERQAVAMEYPVIEAWLREEGISEQELEDTDTIISCGNWPGMDMAFLAVTTPVKNLHLNVLSVNQLLDRIWTEREGKLTYTRLRTNFLQWLNKETGNIASGRELGVNIMHVCLRNIHDPDCYVFVNALKGFIPEDVALTWRKGIRHLRRTCEQNTNFTLEREQLIHQKTLFEALRGFFPEKPLHHMLQLRFCFFRASGGTEEVSWPDFLRDDSPFILHIKKQTIREIEEFTLQVVEKLRSKVDPNRDQIKVKTVSEVLQSCDPSLPDYVVRKLTAEACLKTIRDVAIADDSMTVQINTVLGRFRSAVLLRRASMPSSSPDASPTESPKKKPWER